MRILAVIAHDKKTSLTNTIFEYLVDYLKNKNYTVDVLDLYEHAKDIPFYTHDKATLERNPFFQKNKELVMQADRLLVVFPMYWFSIPGILKCWLDLITNFAWDYQGGFKAQPRHHIKKAFIIYSTIYPWWYCMLVLRNCISHFLSKTFSWMGIQKTYSYAITSIFHMNDKKLEQHKRKIAHILDL